MTTALTLSNYPASADDDAALISCPQSLRDQVVVLNTLSSDVTDYLLEENILIWRRLAHGWVDATNAAARYAVVADAETRFSSRVAAATRWKVERVYYPMSINFNAGETPIFFARVVDSETQTPLISSDVSAIALTIYEYSRNNIRSSVGTGYVPIDNWEGVSLTVADVIDDTPTLDPRCGFAPNLVFEPDTLTNNPFGEVGQYRAVFTITPVEGNKIPVVIDFSTK